MVSKPYPKRYLRNTNTNEIHDTSKEKDQCQLSEILNAHAEWYDTLAQALASTSDANQCHWCIG